MPPVPLRPLLVDLCGGEGGAAMGYRRAGFDVLGVDLSARAARRYPFPMVRADVLEFLASGRLGLVAAFHASPPCQRYSRATQPGQRAGMPDLLPAIREALQATGKPWVIENVPGAPMRPDIQLCGCMFPQLWRLKRKRWFETSWNGYELRAECRHTGPVVSVCGHGRNRITSPELKGSKAEWERAMGIHWMTRNGIKDAVPPAYTEYIGARLMRQISSPLPSLRTPAAAVAA